MVISTASEGALFKSVKNHFLFVNRSICPFINLQKQSSKQKDLLLAQSQMTSGKIAMVKQVMLQN
ncbi:hypothetical protein ECDEC11E_2970 [Escherichia coli DEC11E]|nr:hypothetical protein ECDEC11E_2970 [Escherichia coli DEC11E]